MSTHPIHSTYQLEPGVSLRFDKAGAVLNLPAKPLRASWLQQWKRERTCRKSGGHWWHPDTGMIDWFCCQCGKETDGMPSDGR